MCTYCMMGDWQFRHNPPWQQPIVPSPQYPWHPLIPVPIIPLLPINPWPIEQLKEYLELLKQVKEMEDKLGCPCEPNKADYIGMLQQRIVSLHEELEKKAAEGK